ncbi:hypothetical protein FDJ28_gp57 [Pseudomonas phage Bjorn]|uniref:Uncharacterized protein n=1 Tax=Pseudomonas phage Bjorn TaxID=2079288 RepID=A0A2K9VHH3_9CAUD|nr:hypothetical protein FDJ28_gp57 [Pseudomonas phage Bjorn]AUV61803.1 hypothetical protein PsPhBjorn_gp13 [Pseudomonas phage Bjorn]
MKLSTLVIILLLICLMAGCAVKPKVEPPIIDKTWWSDSVRETMMLCGEAAQKIANEQAGGDPAMADWLYNRCLFDQGVTI